MSTTKRWVDFWNSRVRQLTIWDLKLVQMWTAACILLIVKVFPQIMTLSVWWFVLALVICAPAVIYVFFFRKGPLETDM